MTTTSKRRGPRVLEVWDMRAYLGGPKLLAKHRNPRRVPTAELMKFYGIGAHLRAVLIEGSNTSILQRGDD